MQFQTAKGENMKKTKIISIVLLIAIMLMPTFLVGCSTPHTLPSLSENDGWKQTLHTDFTKIKNEEQLALTEWNPVRHGKRNYEYWCAEMIDYSENGLIIHSEKTDNHNCDICPKEGVFTGGICTSIKDENAPTDKKDFYQAFGYYEATVKVPRGSGMWSAFWLFVDDEGKIGNRGKDGSEIDIYESSFMKNNPTKTGNAVHYDGYGKYYRLDSNVTDIGYSTYDGNFHTYSLLWTPNEYVFFVDGNYVYSTNFGGVSRVPEYIKLTVEIRTGVKGPYGEEIGEFVNNSNEINDFVIKEVNVWQNDNYLKDIKSYDDYKDKTTLYQKLPAIYISVGVFVGIIILSIIIFSIIFVKKKKAKKNSK